MEKTLHWIARLLSLGTLTVTPAYAGDGAYLFGDGNGKRTRLAQQGIRIDLGYTGEAAHNVRGGSRRLTRYTGQWAFGARFDLERRWGWRGSRLDVTITERNGRNLTADAQLPVFQQVQEVYGRGQTWRLTLFAFEQALLDGKLAWKLGRLPVGNDFDSFSCDFQNLTFCGSPPGNIAGDYWYNYPVSQWASVLTWHLSAQSYLKLGAYQLNPRYADDDWARSHGWKLGFPGGTQGVLTPLEFGWTPNLGGWPGNYAIGAWHNSAGGADLYGDADRRPLALTGEAPRQTDTRYGGYLTLRQQVSGVAGGRGTRLFFNATMTDARTSPNDRQFALGAQYIGPFRRAGDTVGFALGATHGSHRLAAYQRLYNQLHPGLPMPVQHGYEYASELFYSWSPLPSLQLRPNLQYVIRPGASGGNKNVFVLGLKTSATF